ncbi:MAG: N-acetylmuramoyl-L-alanine amidase [Rhodobacter sp.]|nr:N-acetylmuramoyl-L-alanine amidase [Rhodobacter sp.]
MISHPSPNFGDRRDGARPDLVVLHYTAMPTADGALAWLCDPASEVSAHYLIAKTGETYRVVEEDRRAWHAGAGAWGAVRDVNSRSIGIELDNIGAEPFPEPQMAALEALLRDIVQRWSIPPERVIAHSDMAPGRKIDPGARFDWARLARQGLSVRTGPSSDPSGPSSQEKALEEADEQAFRDAARAFGYTAEAPTEAILRAVRQRFRPWAEGPLAAADLAVMQDLATRFPVDRGAAGA